MTELDLKAFEQWGRSHYIFLERSSKPGRTFLTEKTEHLWLAFRAGVQTSARDLAEAKAALDGVYTYCNDTLSGRADGGPDDRAWQREAVIHARNLARPFARPEIAAALSPAPAQAGSAGDSQMLASASVRPERTMSGFEAGTEAAASFIEQNELVHTADGEEPRPRRDGNRAGLGYAAGIRALRPMTKDTTAGGVDAHSKSDPHPKPDKEG